MKLWMGLVPNQVDSMGVISRNQWGEWNPDPHPLLHQRFISFQLAFIFGWLPFMMPKFQHGPTECSSQPCKVNIDLQKIFWSVELVTRYFFCVNFQPFIFGG